MKLFNFIIVIVFSCLMITSNSSAIEGNMTISDREVIEQLTRLNENHKTIETNFDELKGNINNRFNDQNDKIDSKSNEVNKRIDDLKDSIDIRFNDQNDKIDSKFNEVNNRIDELKDSIDNRFDEMKDNIDNRFADNNSLIHTLITVSAVVGAGIFATLLLMWRTLSLHKGKFEVVDKNSEDISHINKRLLKIQDNFSELFKHLKPPDKIL